MERFIDLTFMTWGLAILPLFLLLVLMVTGKITVPRAAILAYCCSIVIATVWFESTASVIIVASFKGVSLAVFVLAIIWSSVFSITL